MISASSSELLRAIEAIDTAESHDYGYADYVDGLISLKVNHYISKFETIKKNDGILILEHCEWIKEETDKKAKCVPKCDENGNVIREYFKRLIVGSSHTRGKKAFFIRLDLYGKMDKILLCGIDEYEKENNFPLFKKGCAKWSTYYGLASTDSKPVTYVPNIIIIDDFKKNVTDNFDIVIQTKKIKPEWKEGDNEKGKYIKNYDVENNQEKLYEILPFDGAGLVSVECAKRWADELEIVNSKGISYIPASFQIRVIPGFKGNLYTFDLKQFAKENGNIIKDIKEIEHDLRNEPVDIILTKSQAKFIDLFDSDINKWRKIFDEPVIFYKEDEYGNKVEECRYKRTFNISEYSNDVIDIKPTMLTAYQHLHSIDFTDDEMVSISKRTIEAIESISTDPNEFLKYRSCTEEEEKDNKKEWKRIPPYYRAAYYASDENKKIIFADKYFRSKMEDDIDMFKKRALSGKLYVTGNYQVLTPDLYALAQYAFGKRGKEVTGLLKYEEVYSNWWITKNEKDNSKEEKKYTCNEISITRNPEIYMEARIAKMVSKEDIKRYKEIEKWFKYQITGIVTDIYSTIPLACGTADFDGDDIATSNCVEYMNAVKRARREGNGNTIIMKNIDETGEQKKNLEADITDIEKLMDFDMLAYQNDIGTVIDCVTLLWGIKQNEKNKEEIQKYIKIMVVIGMLTIDAAKSGEFEEIPKDITDYIKSHNILKPYFMKYLPKNDTKLKNEARAIENAKVAYTDKAVVEKQKLFSEDATNLCRVCKHMEQNLSEIETRSSENEFDVDSFFKIFIIDEKPNETSPLYRKVKKALLKLVNEHKTFCSDIELDFKDKKSDEDSGKNKNSHYRCYYAYIKKKILNTGRNTETSFNKILNCVIYQCYKEKEFVHGDSAKTILWNCFGEEMVKRARNNFKDSTLDFSEVAKSMNKTGKRKNKELSQYIGKAPVQIDELDKANYPIIITQDEIDIIKTAINENSVVKIGLKSQKAKVLRILYSVLLVMSKRMEYEKVRNVYSENENGEKVLKEQHCDHCKKSIIISGGKNRINYLSISKLCGFKDSYRKGLFELIVCLQKLKLLTIGEIDMHKPKISLNYEKITKDKADDSLVDVNDYKKACEQIINIVKNE